MARLIDADAIKNLEWMTKRGTADCGEEFVYMSAINEMPTVDAEPVRHGRWIRKLDTRFGPKLNDIIICSNCSIAFSTDNMIRRSYCPNCGARMDEEMEE